MSDGLANFQSAFVQALFDPSYEVTDPQVRALTQQSAFAVHRNTVMKGCIDALEANFPTVARLVGDEWFRSVAALHVRADAPRDGRLLAYTQGFVHFLEHFEPARALGYLPGIARLDALWCECHAAANAPLLDIRWLVGREPEVLAQQVLVPHPATRWAWFDGAPVFTIWSRHRPPGAPTQEAPDLEWRSEGALLTRPGDAVGWRSVDATACAFLDACRRGEPLGQAAEHALTIDPELDLAAFLQGLMNAGAFCAPENHDAEQTP